MRLVLRFMIAFRLSLTVAQIIQTARPEKQARPGSLTRLASFACNCYVMCTRDFLVLPLYRERR